MLIAIKRMENPIHIACAVIADDARSKIVCHIVAKRRGMPVHSRTCSDA
jgi:hypothetical protein